MRTTISSERLVDPSEQVRGLQQPDKTLPVGFWYSVDLSLERIMTAQQPYWYKNKHVHSVELCEERMLFIRAPHELAAFHEEWSYAATKCGPPSPGNKDLICWAHVSEVYDGIEIAPFMPELAKSEPYIQWYGTWSFASGCVWRPRGVRAERLCDAYPVTRPGDDDEEERLYGPKEYPTTRHRTSYMDRTGKLVIVDEEVEYAPGSMLAAGLAAGLKAEFVKEYDRYLARMAKMAPPPMILMEPPKLSVEIAKAIELRDKVSWTPPPDWPYDMDSDIARAKKFWKEWT